MEFKRRVKSINFLCRLWQRRCIHFTALSRTVHLVESTEFDSLVHMNKLYPSLNKLNQFDTFCCLSQSDSILLLNESIRELKDSIIELKETNLEFNEINLVSK